MAVKYTVNLSEAEREQLRSITSKGKTTGRIIKRAQILLLADRLIELNLVENILDETVRRTLKKPNRTLAKGTVVYSDCGSRICVANGRCFRCIRTTSV